MQPGPGCLARPVSCVRLAQRAVLGRFIAVSWLSARHGAHFLDPLAAPRHQLVTRAAYSAGASSQVKWPASRTSSLLCGSRSCRNLALTGGDRRIAGAGDDLHRSVYLRQQPGQDRQLSRVGAQVAERLGEPVSLVGGQVVVPDGLGQRVPADAAQRGVHQLPRVGAAEPVQVGGLDDVLDHPAELERDRGGAAADDQAPQPARMPRRGEQRGRGAGAGGDDMRVLEPERVGGGDDELAHRPRGQQRVAALGMPEPRQVHGHQVGMLREPPPDRLEGQQALRPRAEQEGMIGVPSSLAANRTVRPPMSRNRISKDAFSQVVTISLLTVPRPATAYLTSSRLQGCDRVPQVASPGPWWQPRPLVASGWCDREPAGPGPRSAR